jgi:hypothetical protein
MPAGSCWPFLEGARILKTPMSEFYMTVRSNWNPIWRLGVASDVAQSGARAWTLNSIYIDAFLGIVSEFLKAHPPSAHARVSGGTWRATLHLAILQRSPQVSTNREKVQKVQICVYLFYTKPSNKILFSLEEEKIHFLQIPSPRGICDHPLPPLHLIPPPLAPKP